MNARFERLQEREGQSLFPKAKEPEKVLLNQLKYEVVYYADSNEFNASVAGWGLSAGAGFMSSSHHASYRALQLEYALILDDQSKMRDAPDGALFYASTIYYGRSYELVMHGASAAIDSYVSAQFVLFGGEAGYEHRSDDLEFSAFGRGLVPHDDKAIFANSPKAIKKAYDSSGPTVPVLIEYRVIPGATNPVKQFQWPTKFDIELKLGKLQVVDDGTEGATPWRLGISCSVNGRPLPASDPIVFDDTIDAGAERELNWSQPYSVHDGEELECVLDGTYTSFWFGPNPLKKGIIRIPAAITGEKKFQPIAGKLQVTAGKAKYVLDYEVRGQNK